MKKDEVKKRYSILPWKITPRHFYGEKDIVEPDGEIFSAYNLNEVRIGLCYLYYSIEKRDGEYFFILKKLKASKLEENKFPTTIARMGHSVEYYNDFINALKKKMKNMKNWKKTSDNEVIDNTRLQICLYKNKVYGKGLIYNSEKDVMLLKERAIFKTIDEFFNVKYLTVEKLDPFYNRTYEDVEKFIQKNTNDWLIASEYSRYCMENGISEENKLKIYNELKKYPDILEEFFKIVLYGINKNDPPLEVKGYTASEISRLDYSLKYHEICLLMANLREDPVNTKKILEKYNKKAENNESQEIEAQDDVCVSNATKTEINNIQTVNLDNSEEQQENESQLLDNSGEDKTLKNNENEAHGKNDVVEYLEVEQKLNNKEALRLYEELQKYDDILNEFLLSIQQKNYDLKNPISINDYSAKKIFELNPNLKPYEIYLLMKGLRDEPEKTEAIIKDWIN